VMRTVLLSRRMGLNVAQVQQRSACRLCAPGEFAEPRSDAVKACMRSLFVLLLGLTACFAGVSSYARATAGRIGCPAGEIEIRDAEDDLPGPRSWVAICSGRSYACSSSGELTNVGTRIVCTERDHGGEHAPEHAHDEEHEHDDN
jgi:hypothetical protein